MIINVLCLFTIVDKCKKNPIIRNKYSKMRYNCKKINNLALNLYEF